jgi:hypothetical protein
MTMTPVVGEVAGVWARVGSAMDVAPVSVRVSARMTLRIAFIGFASPVRLICNSDLRPLSARDYPR